ncbi:hypothetical protein [Kineococcus sp. SYSU DK006]|uniref:hypothetical protein n=1 Tax=Kineococcus sp. SYSU DK006 TaxID=3383127 RepID=UPI003D7E2087
MTASTDGTAGDGTGVVATASVATASVAKASMVGAAAGGLVLVVLTLPLLVHAVMWSVFDPGAAPWSTLSAMAAAGLLPVPLAAGIAWAQRADVRVTAVLVGVPQLVLSAALSLFWVWGRQ